MQQNKAALIVDIGTTNCKVSSFSCLDSTCLHSVKFETPKIISPDGAVDFDTDKLWESIQSSFKQLVDHTEIPVSCISLASFGESGVYIDDNDEIITPMLAWYDRRGEAFVNDISSDDAEKIYSISGLPVHSNYSAFKMRWLIESYGLQDRQDIQWLHAPEVILWKLTGERRTDITLASRTLCLDINTRSWSKEAADILGVPFNAFSPLIGNGEVAGYVSEELASELGFTQPVSVILAGHDHMVGARALRMKPGEILNSTGTTEGILVLNHQPTLDEQARLHKLSNGNYSLPDLYTLFASLPIGGYALEWMSKTFRYDLSEIDLALSEGYQRYINNQWHIDNIPIFIPHLRGSGSPHKNRHTRGLIHGLGDNLTIDNLIASISIGLVMEFANCFSCFSISHDKPMKVIGPATKNPLWLQLKADLLQRPIEAVSFDEAISIGALVTACPDVKLPDGITSKVYMPDKQRGKALLDYQKSWLDFYGFKLGQEGIFSNSNDYQGAEQCH